MKKSEVIPFWGSIKAGHDRCGKKMVGAPDKEL